MFIRRPVPGRPDRFLEWKVRLFFAGAALLVAGIFFERRVLVALAIAVLLVGVALRFVDRGPPPPLYDEEGEEGDGEDVSDPRSERDVPV